MKSYYMSKTLWFNLLTGIVAVSGIFGFAGYQPEPKVVELIGVVVAAVNIALRFATKEPIA